MGQSVDGQPYSLTLEEAEHQFLSHSADVAIGRATVTGAEAGIISARARPNPTLGFSSASINPHEGVGSGHIGDKRADSILSINQVFERGNKRELREIAATANLAAASDDFADTVRQQHIAVANAFYDLLAAQQRYDLAKVSAQFAQRSAYVAETRLAAGDLARVDVARSRADSARAAADSDQAQGDLEHARIALALLLGEEAQAQVIRAQGDWPPSIEVARAPVSIETILATRADIAAARARVEVARSSRDLARAQKSRDVTIGVQAEHNPPTSHAPLYGFSVSVPLFIGNDFRGDIAKAEADYTVALETLHKVEMNARAELATQKIDVEILEQRARRFSQELLPEASRAATAAEFAFAHGAMGVGDLLDARRVLKAAEQDAVAAQAGHAKALYAWRIERVAEGSATSPENIQ